MTLSMIVKTTVPQLFGFWTQHDPAQILEYDLTKSGRVVVFALMIGEARSYNATILIILCSLFCCPTSYGLRI